MSELDHLLAALDEAAEPESRQRDPHAAPALALQLAQLPELESASDETALRAARALAVHGPPQTLPAAGELAARAHRAGVAGAGALFAECVDRLSVMSGRPQRFGTVVARRQGDLVPAPVDGSVDEDERTRLGVATLAARRADLRAKNEAAARARAAEPGLPAGERFCRLWRDPTAAEIDAGLAAHPDGSWANGDELTIACRSENPHGFLAGPVFELPLWRVAGGDDPAGPAGALWALTVRVERLSEAVIGYGFWPLDADGNPAGGERGPVDHRFRGPDAPPELPSNADDALAGTVVSDTVSSTALRENRRATVYVPPGHDAGASLPVVYGTDGRGAAAYIRRIDAGIVAGAVPPFVLVAAHAAPLSAYGNERVLEYLPGFDDNRFERHQRFFVDELAQWAQERFGVSSEREQRAVFGCSDGGGHALATGSLHRDRFGHVIAFSTGMPPDAQLRWDAAEAPFVHLCAGTLEGAFHQATQAWAAWLHFAESPHHWTERVCGHDLIQWIEEFPRAVARAWG